MSVDTVWGYDNVISLIKHYQKHELLWNSSHPDYRNKIKKQAAWHSMARALKLPRKFVETKIHTLRSQFMRERKRLAPSKPGEAAKTSGWFAYKPMMFLLKGKTDSATMDTLDTNSLQSQDTVPSPKSPEEEPVQMEFQDEAQASFDHLETQSSSSSSSGRKPAPRSYLTPFRNNRNRRASERASDNGLDEALKILRAAKAKADLANAADGFTIYGNYIASELRCINDERSVLMAKYHINEIIFNAAVGKYRSGNNSTVQQGQSSVQQGQSRLRQALSLQRGQSSLQQGCGAASSDAVQKGCDTYGEVVVKVELSEEQIIPDVPNSHRDELDEEN